MTELNLLVIGAPEFDCWYLVTPALLTTSGSGCCCSGAEAFVGVDFFVQKHRKNANMAANTQKKKDPIVVPIIMSLDA